MVPYSTAKISSRSLKTWQAPTLIICLKRIGTRLTYNCLRYLNVLMAVLIGQPWVLPVSLRRSAAISLWRIKMICLINLFGKNFSLLLPIYENEPKYDIVSQSHKLRVRRGRREPSNLLWLCYERLQHIPYSPYRKIWFGQVDPCERSVWFRKWWGMCKWFRSEFCCSLDSVAGKPSSP